MTSDTGTRLLSDTQAGPSEGAIRHMIILGIILLVVGFIAAIHLIWIIGIIVLLIGVALAVAGLAGREIGGRKHWY